MENISLSDKRDAYVKRDETVFFKILNILFTFLFEVSGFLDDTKENSRDYLADDEK